MDGEARNCEGPSQTGQPMRVSHAEYGKLREEFRAQCDMTAPTGPTYIYQEVSIRKVTNGFIIHVGCKTFVSTRWGEIALGLGEYWTDPNAAERKYSK